MAKKMQHCFNCGEELGVYDKWPGDIEVCGKQECVREARYADQAERDERYHAAREDDFSRYSGGW